MWKNLNGALESIRSSYKELGIPEGTKFEAIHFRAGEQQMRIDAGKCGPAMAEKLPAFEGKGANFIIRASVPAFSNEAAAGCLNDVLNILYTGRDEETAVMCIFHLDDRGDVWVLKDGFAAPTAQ